VLLNRLLGHARLRHLQVLVQVAELGSLKRAAEAVGLTQPALTHIVGDLEQLLGTRLFERHSRGVTPLPAAQDLLPVARRMIATLNEGAEAVAARLQGADGRVRMAATTAALGAVLAEALPGFADAHPRIQVQVLPAEGDAYPGMIERGEVDAVACRQPAVLPAGWDFHVLAADELVVVCSPAHPLARQAQVRLADLAGQTWLVPPARNLARTALEQLCEELGWTPQLAPVVTRALPMTWALLKHQRVVSLLPSSVVRQLLQAGQLARLKPERRWPLEPLGLLVPAERPGEATSNLLRWLQGAC